MAKKFFNKFLSGGLKFWVKNQSVVSIDMGSSSLKIVQLRKEKERAILETYGELSVGPYVKKPVGQVSRLSGEILTQMIKDLLKESGANAKEAVVSIPIRSSFITTIRLPVIEGKSMEEMIKFEARKYIPVPITEVEVDWWILGSPNINKEKEEEKRKIKMMDILLVVIYKDAIRKYQNIIIGAGLKIKSFELEVFSGLRALSFRPTSPVLVIDLGASSTKMSIVDEGLLKLSYTIDRGSQAITSALSRSLEISFERAEEMKQKIGLSRKPEHMQMIEVIEPLLDIIFAEVRQFMQSYSRKYKNSVGQVVLLGGGALLNGIVETAVKNLGVEVMLADPFSKTDHPPFLEEALKEIGPAFSTSVGLALSGL